MLLPSGACSAALAPPPFNPQNPPQTPSKPQNPDKIPRNPTTPADVEAEKRYQEKRAAEKAGEPIPPPPVVLWRSVRELGVWLKDLRRARSAGALGGATYAAAALVDRAHVSEGRGLGFRAGGRDGLSGLAAVVPCGAVAALCVLVSANSSLFAPALLHARHPEMRGLLLLSTLHACSQSLLLWRLPLLPPRCCCVACLLPHRLPPAMQRLMSNLALSRIRTGQAAYIAEDRDIAVTRKADLLLGPTPTDAALQAEAAAAAAAALPAAADDARNSNVLMTSSGRRVKVGCGCLAGRLGGWLAGRLVGCLAVWLAGWLR